MSKVAVKRRRKPSAEKKRTAKVKRAELAALSRAVKAAMNVGMIDCATVNEALLEIYAKDTGQTDFRKFKEWKEAGYSVRKGESAFRVWAKPRKIAKPPEGREQSSEGKDEFDWFPICCLFHAGQVENEDGKPPLSFVSPAFQPLPLALPAPGETHHRQAS